jgi:hypothetical protein
MRTLDRDTLSLSELILFVRVAIDPKRDQRSIVKCLGSKKTNPQPLQNTFIEVVMLPVINYALVNSVDDRHHKV